MPKEAGSDEGYDLPDSPILNNMAWIRDMKRKMKEKRDMLYNIDEILEMPLNPEMEQNLAGEIQDLLKNADADAILNQMLSPGGVDDEIEDIQQDPRKNPFINNCPGEA